MQNEITIRSYTAGDKEALLSLLRLNTPAYFSPEEEKDFVHYLDHETELYYVILVKDRVAGGGGINFIPAEQEARISWDVFHPDYQGQGLGTSLLRYRLGRIRERADIARIVVRTSQQAFGFYRKQGFQLNRTVKDYWAPGFDLYHMEYGSDTQSVDE